MEPDIQTPVDYYQYLYTLKIFRHTDSIKLNTIVRPSNDVNNAGNYLLRIGVDIDNTISIDTSRHRDSLRRVVYVDDLGHHLSKRLYENSLAYQGNVQPYVSQIGMRDEYPQVVTSPALSTLRHHHFVRLGDQPNTLPDIPTQSDLTDSLDLGIDEDDPMYAKENIIPHPYIHSDSNDNAMMVSGVTPARIPTSSTTSPPSPTSSSTTSPLTSPVTSASPPSPTATQTQPPLKIYDPPTYDLLIPRGYEYVPSFIIDSCKGYNPMTRTYRNIYPSFQLYGRRQLMLITNKGGGGVSPHDGMFFFIFDH